MQSDNNPDWQIVNGQITKKLHMVLWYKSVKIGHMHKIEPNIHPRLHFPLNWYKTNIITAT